MKTNTLIEFKFIKDIFHCQWALISLGFMQDDTPVLEMWCDINDEKDYNLYAYAFIRPEDLKPFINSEKSYFNVLKDSNEIILFKYNDKAYDFEIISNENYLHQYGPQESSDLSEDLINFREALEQFYNEQKEVI